MYTYFPIPIVCMHVSIIALYESRVILVSYKYQANHIFRVTLLQYNKVSQYNKVLCDCFVIGSVVQSINLQSSRIQLLSLTAFSSEYKYQEAAKETEERNREKKESRKYQ